MEINIEKTYQTRDLYEAAALHSLGVHLLKLKSDGKQYWFIFRNLKKSQRLADRYWRGILPVQAKAYTDSIKSLKDRIFNQK